VLEDRPHSATMYGHWSGGVTVVSATAFGVLVQRDRDVQALLDATRSRQLRNADRRRIVTSMDVQTRVVSQLLEWASRYGERTSTGRMLRG
jgi:hypothetical protein